MIETNVLREKVLDLAIRGKLVPQDPNDEPASVLLERIRAEKQQMVKDGKLKAKDIKNDTIIFKGEDNLHYEKFQDGTVKCIEDEIPFEVPEGWEWERLGNISSIARGSSPRPIKSYLTTDANGVNWIKIGDTEKDGKYIFSTKEKIKPEGMVKSRYVKCGDFLLTNSMSFGRPYILKTDGCIHDGWLVIGNIKSVFNQDYLYYALSANFMYKALAVMAGGSTVDNLNLDLVKTLLFPIPPIDEQISIAQKVDDLLMLAKTINGNEKIIKNDLEQVKSKILDLAIRGKLVPQDPNDEPASVLLERIHAEKEELIKQGKIKRDKKESIIFKGDDNSYYEKIDENIVDITDEIPFDIPENWAWCRLNMLCKKEIKRGKAPKYSKISSTLVFAQKCNTKKGFINISLAQYLDESILKKYPPEFFMQYNDIVINSTGTGTLGRVGIFEKSDDIYGLPIVPDSHITTIRVSELVVAKYIYVLLKLKQPYLETSGEGSTNQKELRSETLSNIIVPLPPVLEQKQIVDTINTINQTLNNMEQSLN